MEELKPCPFCGSEAQYSGSLVTPPLNHVLCTKCPVGTRAFPEREAGDFWNTRAKAKELPLETVERVARVIAEASGYPNWPPPYRQMGFNRAPVECKPYWMRIARAAISSMGDDGLREALAVLEEDDGSGADRADAMADQINRAVAILRTSLGTDGL